MRAEIQRRQSNTNAVAAFFRQHVGEWINAVELEKVGGRQAWRSRVSDCRVDLEMYIENRQRREYCQAPASDVWFVTSEYRFLEHAPIGRPADVPQPDRWPVFDAPLGETWRLT